MPPPRDPTYANPALYDAINTPGTALEVSGLQAIAARFVLGKSGPVARRSALALNWFEPACGTGRYLRVLASRMDRNKVAGARAGRIVGIDLEPTSLAYGLERLEALPHRASRFVRLARADMRRIGPRAVPAKFADVAFCLQNTIRHLPTEQDLVSHLRSIRRVLSPRGVYAVGIELTGVSPNQFPSEAVYTAVRGTSRYRQVFEYLPATSIEDPFETVIAWAEMTPTRGSARPPIEFSSTYRLRSWSLDQWHRCVASAGLVEVGVVDSHAKPLSPARERYAIRLLKRRGRRRAEPSIAA